MTRDILNTDQLGQARRLCVLMRRAIRCVEAGYGRSRMTRHWRNVLTGNLRARIAELRRDMAAYERRKKRAINKKTKGA
jgi:hypothetical protein